MFPAQKISPLEKVPLSELRVSLLCVNSRSILLQNEEYPFQPPLLNARVSLNFEGSSSRATKLMSMPRKRSPAGSRELRDRSPCADLTFATAMTAKKRSLPPRLLSLDFNI